VYLDIGSWRAAASDRGFETVLRNLLRGLESQITDEAERWRFAEDAAKAQAFVSGLAPGAGGLVLFCDASEGFVWWRVIAASLPSDARWSETPYIRPLLETLDEFERYGVVLSDRAHARLFTVFMGEIEEHREVFAAAPVRHLKTTGTDRLWSERNLQRRADAHSRWHLKDVALQTDDLARRLAFDRLILAGPVQATHDLGRLLPRRLRSRVVATITLALEATDRQVLDAALEVARAVERSEELRVVDDLITTATKGDAAVVGPAMTLERLRERRVWQLVYAEGMTIPGGRCADCGRLVAEPVAACPGCGGTPRPLDDLLEPMLESTLTTGGRIEQVRGEAAGRLRSAGGIGAYLRH
jgi:peptide subunit release factor 1 (eRF1)